MEVNVWAERTYTASTIAIVDSDPDTLTDSASQFVIEDFVAGMPVGTDDAGNHGPFKIATVSAGTITLDSTESVAAVTAGSSITITSRADFGYLPSDFWGLRENFEPYIDGKTWSLMPLSNQTTRLQYQGAGDPRYYRIIGTKIHLTPETSSDYTIKADYYKRPTEVAGATATIPFNELFDDLIAEYVEIGFRGAQNNGNKIAILDKLLADGVDTVASRYDRRGATAFTHGMTWGF
jgi:hypothetical protein